jgi:hypothetical protein
MENLDFGQKPPTSDGRWCFASDDDGHDYLIPVELREKFKADMEKAYSSDDFSGVDWVDQYRTGCHINCYSFADPKDNL